jgi:hypothetical protein
MPVLELTKDELVVHLRAWEALASVHRSIRVPLANVRGATEDEGFRGRELGLRAPGTGLPGVLHAGTFYKDGDRQFVFIGPHTHPVVIELENEKWRRIVLGVEDARQAAADVSRAIAR